MRKIPWLEPGCSPPGMTGYSCGRAASSDDVETLGDTLLRVNGRTLRLRDITAIKRGYIDPPSDTMRFDHQNVLGIGVTMAPSADVIVLGKRLDAETTRLRASLPAGLKLVEVSSMPHAVALSIDDFVEAVAEAIIIVLLVSLVSSGRGPAWSW